MSTIDVPPPIGSLAWDAELVAVGTSRAEVDEELRSYDGEPMSTSRPMPMSSGSAIVVTGPGWKRPDCFLLDMAVTRGPWRMRHGAELLLDGQVRGHLVHWAYPFRSSLAHTRLPGRDLGHRAEFHLVKADPATAADFVDREFEVWLPGLREYAGQAAGGRRGVTSPDS